VHNNYKKKRQKEEAKKLLKKKKIVAMELVPAGLKRDNISEEDYFAKSNELAMWLKEAQVCSSPI
jgi:translation initiation factor IF-3